MKLKRGVFDKLISSYISIIIWKVLSMNNIITVVIENAEKNYQLPNFVIFFLAEHYDTY